MVTEQRAGETCSDHSQLSQKYLQFEGLNQ